MKLDILLKNIEISLYVVAIIVTIVLAVYSFYLVVEGLAGLRGAPYPEDAVYSILASLFLFIIFVELIDTFVTYIQEKEIIVYKIIDVALVALARELFIYISPTNKSFDINHAYALVAALGVIGVIDYLQHRARR
ncbi:phosphate-starvation-inducible PsiE family protein [Thermoproteus tenax]|uniref:Phosphate-starvation-inducible E n=1 Tax=Thermoproteus tenax (strain ATCC 35583 / DSM 2078 / JCM 9277 / NBRC 100435 / Kra 1) TaxID=768679 RepID=G4RPS2_THETK|nr:phosphate-starvation-inducible PsiE family protein [Thermoproteus tenax]CCC81567.1 conserved hypothetical protein [Thermoproteus tenax Kra 1]